MKLEEYIKAYEDALASQDWNIVDPLISEHASVTFSDGSVHHGKSAMQAAFQNKSFDLVHVPILQNSKLT